MDLNRRLLQTAEISDDDSENEDGDLEIYFQPIKEIDWDDNFAIFESYCTDEDFENNVRNANFPFGTITTYLFSVINEVSPDLQSVNAEMSKVGDWEYEITVNASLSTDGFIYMFVEEIEN